MVLVTVAFSFCVMKNLSNQCFCPRHCLIENLKVEKKKTYGTNTGTIGFRQKVDKNNKKIATRIFYFWDQYWKGRLYFKNNHTYTQRPSTCLLEDGLGCRSYCLIYFEALCFSVSGTHHQGPHRGLDVLRCFVVADRNNLSPR